MQWPRNLGEWGFVLSLLALLSMYPVGVLINWTTPAIRDWWARQSQARLKKRIEKLESEVRTYSGVPTFDAFQNIVITALKTILLCLVSATHAIIWAVAPKPVHIWSQPYMGHFMVVGLSLYCITNVHNRFRVRYRRQREERLRLLRSKLI
jgi:hypothetical protein